MAFQLTVQKSLNFPFIQHYFNVNLQAIVYLTEPAHYDIIEYVPELYRRLAKGKASLILTFKSPCMYANKHKKTPEK